MFTISPVWSAQCVFYPKIAFAAKRAHLAQTLLSVFSGTAAAGKSSAQALDDDGDALSAADACRGQPVAFPAAAQLVQQGDDEARSGGSQRMAEGDRAAVDVQLLHVDAELLRYVQHLAGEAFVHLNHIDLLH